MARGPTGYSKADIRGDLSFARTFLSGVRAELGADGCDEEALANAREALEWVNSACVRIEERIEARGESPPSAPFAVIFINGRDAT